jgi:hypothetical protein
MGWEWTFAENARRYGMNRLEDDLIRMCAAFRWRHPESRLSDEELRGVMRVAREVVGEPGRMRL